MAGKDIITRTATKAYVERKVKGMGIEELIFNTPDNDTSAAFRLDRYISTPYGIAYRNLATQSVVRKFNPGTTELITVPIASEKTPIDEELQDVVSVGYEPTVGQAQQLMNNVEFIVGDHLEGHGMTARKQAITVLETGVFPAFGEGGKDLGLGYDHGRDVGNAITYDFTGAGATMSEAVLDLAQKADSVAMPKQDRCVLLGSDWISQYGSDTGIIELMQANSANQVIEQDMFERKFGNVDGLWVVARFKPVGATAPVWLLDYTPDTAYIAYDGATPEAFVPATKALMFSLADKSYRINRGVSAKNGSGISQRVVGDVVVDSFETTDPDTKFVRSQTRHMYLYANINHTVVSTGTFS